MTLFAGIFATLLLAQEGPEISQLSLIDKDATTQPTTQPTLEELRAKQKEEIEKEIAGMPHRGKIAVNQLVTIETVDGYLHINSPIEATDGMVTYEPINWPGWIELTVGSKESNIISFSHIAPIEEKAIESRTFVMTGVGNVQIGRDTGNDEGVNTNISLIQTLIADDDSEDPVRLNVHKTFDAGNVPDYDLKLSAKDFDQLRRHHPREVRSYLGPILKDLHAESILQDNDIQLAWQVLGPEIEPDPQLNEKLKTIVEKLKVDDFALRAKAEDELAAMGPQAASALSHWDLGNLPADPKATIENFIRTQQKATKEQVKQLRSNPDAILDFLYIGNASIQKAVQTRLGELTGKSFTLPANLSADERMAKIEEMRKSITPTTQP